MTSLLNRRFAESAERFDEPSLVREKFKNNPRPSKNKSTCNEAKCPKYQNEPQTHDKTRIYQYVQQGWRVPRFFEGNLWKEKIMISLHDNKRNKRSDYTNSSTVTSTCFTRHEPTVDNQKYIDT